MASLANGGSTDGYEWGQTVADVTLRLSVPGLRGRDLQVEVRRQHICISPKGGGDNIIKGQLWQPVLVDETEWTVADGVLEVKLAKDTRRDENARLGPSSEWWHGVLLGEESLDRSLIAVDEYVRMEQLPAEQQAALRREEQERASVAQCEEVHRERAAREGLASRRAEAALPEATRRGLEQLRSTFPDATIEYGDTGSFRGY